MKITRNVTASTSYRKSVSKSNLKAGTGSTSMNSLSNKVANAKKILEADKAKSLNAATRLKKNYEEIGKSAESLANSTTQLRATDENSVFSKARTSKNMEAVTAQILSWTGSYNKMIGKLGNIDRNVEKVYARQLTQYSTTQKSALKEIGITLLNDGSLKVNTKVLKKATLEKVEKLFGPKSTYLEKVSSKTANIETEAEAQLVSLNKTKASSQKTYTANA